MPEFNDNPRPAKGYVPQGRPRYVKPKPKGWVPPMTAEREQEITEAIKRSLVRMDELFSQIRRDKAHLHRYESWVEYVEQEYGLLARRAFMRLVQPQAVESLSEPLAAAEVSILDEIARLTYGHEVEMLEFVDYELEQGGITGQAIEASALDLRRRRRLTKAGKPVLGGAPAEQKARAPRPARVTLRHDEEDECVSRQIQAARRLGLGAIDLAGKSREEIAALLGE